MPENLLMEDRPSVNEPQRKGIALVACEVMRAELELVARSRNCEVCFLDQGLHRTPRKMAALVQEKIDQFSATATRVVVGYGLCSGGIKGITARNQELVVPRCHDCIALFLGSRKAYEKLFRSNPGTYYLTPGWLEAKKDPLGIIHEDYAPKHGLETAFWVMEEELKHYTHIALINTGAGNLDEIRARTRENCAVLGKEYFEIEGTLEYFERLIGGPYSPDDFLIIPPNAGVTEEMFF